MPLTVTASPCSFSKKNYTQLCLWTKIRTRQWLVLGASAYQCMHAGFLCPKCNNFDCSYTRQDQTELHLKRWFFLPKSAYSVSRSQAHLAKRKCMGYTSVFVRQKDKTNFFSNQTWAKCYHKWRSLHKTCFNFFYEKKYFFQQLNV